MVPRNINDENKMYYMYSIARNIIPGIYVRTKTIGSAISACRTLR